MRRLKLMDVRESSDVRVRVRVRVNMSAVKVYKWYEWD